MSQHDLTINNQGFPAFRADLNNALQALGSTQSGTTAPSPTFANQLWYDTTNNILKIRNADNDAWISLLTLNQTSDSVSSIDTGTAILSAGTVSAPSLTTTGDTNTGIFFPAADTIAFAEGGAEAMRIDSDGDVGIGTNSPTVLLDAYRAGSGDKAVFRNATRGLYINVDGSGGGIFTGAGQTGNFFGLDAANNVATIGTNGTERMRLNSTGALVLQGGSGTANGVGITFPASQSASSDANCLDDYEEGTWTPNVIHQSSNNSTWTIKNGYYTKVGRLVTAWFVCDGGNSGTSGSPLQVTGMPFALGTFSASVTWGLWSTNGTVKNGGFVESSSGATALFLYSGGGSLTQQQDYASGCITYFTS